MIAQGRIRGDVAARLIAEGIEREKGGYAAKQATTSVTGAEQRFQTLSVIRAAEGTEKATQGIGDFYRQANQVLGSDQAQKFVAFIDKTTGSLINLVERGLRSGLNLATGLANGIESGESITRVTGAVKNIGTAAIDSLESLWKMNSPSRLFAEKGANAVEGLALGIESEESRARLRAALENLLNDPRIKAMLDTISFSEGAGYNTMVGGGRISDLSKHPNKVVKLRGGSEKLSCRPISISEPNLRRRIKAHWPPGFLSALPGPGRS
jgi:hypothetical protein